MSDRSIVSWIIWPDCHILLEINMYLDIILRNTGISYATLMSMDNKCPVTYRRWYTYVRYV